MALARNAIPSAHDDCQAANAPGDARREDHAMPHRAGGAPVQELPEVSVEEPPNWPWQPTPSGEHIHLAFLPPGGEEYVPLQAARPECLRPRLRPWLSAGALPRQLPARVRCRSSIRSPAWL